MKSHHSQDLMPGEHVLWQGRPTWQAIARDVLHIGWIAFYLAVELIWSAWTDRSQGLSPGATLMAALPLVGLAAVLLGGCAAFAWECARTTRYLLTNQRVVLNYGMALSATLSLPLRRIGMVSVSTRADGNGDIPLALAPGHRLPWLKLWPHARPWQLKKPQPMLRGLDDAARVALLLSRAVASVQPGHLSAAGAPAASRRETGLALPMVSAMKSSMTSAALAKAPATTATS